MRSLGITAFFSVLCVFWAGLVGKDLGWDIANHHFYLPFAWFEGRIHSDLYAAGPQSYQNPLGFFPFYFMVQGGFPSWLIGALLALLHSINFIFIERIARSLWARSSGREGWIFISLALSWVAPIFLFVVGSSTVDAIGSALVLAALALILLAVRARAAIAGAGFLLALSFCIKQSNAVFVLAGAAVLLWQWLRGRRAFSDLLFCAFGVVIGLLLGMGWYSWFLWQEYGSPIFPLYNNIFESPYAAHSSAITGRFIPGDVSGYFWRLWDISQMKRFVYFEGFSPDIRPIALMIFSVLGVCMMCVAAMRRRVLQKCYVSTDSDLFIFVVVGYFLWMMTSGNGRYALPLLLLCGLMLARCIYLFISERIARIVGLLIIFLQMGYTLTAADLRFVTEPWDSGPYYKIEAADRLVREPFLHLALGIQTNASVISTKFHAEGALVNPIGQVSLPLDKSPLGEAFEKRLDIWRGRTRVILREFDMVDVNVRAQALKRIDELLYRMRLRVDLDDCERFTISRTAPVAQSLFSLVHAKNSFILGAAEQRYISCAALGVSEENAVMEMSMAKADKVFSIMESMCPNIYGPPGFASDRGGDDWRRFYPNTDSSAIVSETNGVVVQSPRSPVDRYIGTVDDVLQGRGHFDCKERNLVTPD